MLFNEGKCRTEVMRLATVERQVVDLKLPTINHVDHFADASKMVRRRLGRNL